jgi:SAM-dependent methyltransferase
MNYGQGFFDNYSRYLKDPEVKDKHRRIFDLFCDHFDPFSELNVADMGCGTAEFGRYVAHSRDSKYVGYDLDISRVDFDPEYAHMEATNCRAEVGDYTIVMPEKDSLVVSLFATEIHLCQADRELLYSKWLDSGVPAILVSGFYYKDSPTEAARTELLTGMRVFQTPMNMEFRPGEIRLQQEIPAGMFVDEFVEVWRILERGRC